MNKLLGLLAVAFALWIPPAQADDDWLKDEVLKQLSELRQDNHALRGELDGLKQRLAALESRGKDTPRKLADLLGGRTPLGDPSAKLIIAEFTDYQCPYCKKFALSTFPKVRKDYLDTGQARYVVRDYPLAFHGAAQSAAIAANCAGRQKAYWDMKARLFEHQADLGRDLYLREAGAIKLDGERFRACLDDPAEARAVARDLAYGEQAGVQATPTFLIGRIEGDQVRDLKAVSGAMDYDAFAKLLDSMLKPR